MSINIMEKPLFIEAWHEGSVEWEGQEYKFWLINPVRLNSEDQDYELEVRWFFKNVPKEVRAMYNDIIEHFKKTNYDNRSVENKGSSL